ncbi:MAG: ECF transporter S component [Lactobacillus sp.]|nr:ECF transporter S component [Lactobacillus sp.]
MKNKLSLKLIAALLGALSYLVMQFEFPIMPGVDFLKFDFSDIIIVATIVCFGYSTGIITAFVRLGLALIIHGFSPFSLIGEVAAFIAVLLFTLPLIYRKKLLSLVAGIFLMAIGLSILNYFIITPLYALVSLPHVDNFSITNLIKIADYQYIRQLLHLPSLMTYIMTIVLPFNFLKGIINTIVMAIFWPTLKKNLIPYFQKQFFN